MHDKEFYTQRHKKFYRTGEISFKWLIFLTVLLRAEFRTQSKICDGAFFVKILNDF